MEYRNRDIADMSIYILILGTLVFIQNGFTFILKPTLESFLQRLPLTLALIVRVFQHLYRLRFNNNIGYMMTVVYLLQIIAVMVLNYNTGLRTESNITEV